MSYITNFIGSNGLFGYGSRESTSVKRNFTEIEREEEVVFDDDFRALVAEVSRLDVTTRQRELEVASQTALAEAENYCGRKFRKVIIVEDIAELPYRNSETGFRLIVLKYAPVIGVYSFENYTSKIGVEAIPATEGDPTAMPPVPATPEVPSTLWLDDSQNGERASIEIIPNTAILKFDPCSFGYGFNICESFPLRYRAGIADKFSDLPQDLQYAIAQLASFYINTGGGVDAMNEVKSREMIFGLMKRYRKISSLIGSDE